MTHPNLSPNNKNGDPLKHAAQILYSMKRNLGSWQQVANALSEDKDRPINVGNVWAVAHEKKSIPQIINALGLKTSPQRFRRYADLGDAATLQQLDDVLNGYDLTLSQLCRGLATRTIHIEVTDG